MRKITFKKVVIASVLIGAMLLFCLPSVSMAASADMLGKLTTVKDNSGLGGTTGENALPIAIGKIIGVVLGILGVLFIVLIIYAGFLWMTAAGDDGKVKKAKDIIVAATIGLVIILASYSISYFVIQQLQNATNS